MTLSYRPPNLSSNAVEALEPRRLLDGDLPARVEVNLNGDWRFIKQPMPAASAKLYDDSSWSRVNLPHTYNALDGQDGGNDYFRGETWYRKRYRLPEVLAGRQYYLRFEGVGHSAEVWVNGAKAGEHKGAFSAFVFDLNPFVKVARANYIAVKVSNADDRTLAPRKPDWTVAGGIYRDVKLIAMDTAHVDPTDYASPGVYLTQSNVGASSATVSARTLLRNSGAKPRKFDVITTILDADGAAVTSQTTRVRLDPRSRAPLKQTLTVTSPKLWDGVRNPYLYTARVELRNVEAAALDAVTQPLGLRSFKVDPANGLTLNGRYYDLRGVAMHQDWLNKGPAVGDAHRKQDVDLAREVGSTGLRLAHYQHDDYTYQLADEHGLVVWAEVPVYGAISYDATAAYTETSRRQLVELIRQNYNHPSILFWSIGNELENDEASRQVLANLNALAKAEDSGRLTTYASKFTDRAINYMAETTGLNRYDGWYAGDVQYFGAALDQVHRNRPDVAIGLSEYGVGGSPFQHVNDPNPSRPAETATRFHPEQYLNVFHEKAWSQIAAKKYLWSKFVWSLTDFASDARWEGQDTGRVDKGLVTYDRKTKKDAFYFYKANWTNTPVLYITSRRYTDRDEATTEVKVYSNLDSVELRLNGKLIGTNSSKSYGVFRWSDVTLQAGQNLLEVRSAKNGKTYTDSVTWTYTPAAASASNTIAAPPPAPFSPFADRSVVDELQLV